MYDGSRNPLDRHPRALFGLRVCDHPLDMDRARATCEVDGENPLDVCIGVVAIAGSNKRRRRHQDVDRFDASIVARIKRSISARLVS
jgi:hypothetical protein